MARRYNERVGQQGSEYVFESAMVLNALVLQNFHRLGKLIPGKEVDLPSEKQGKEAKMIERTIHGRAETDV